MYYPVLLLISVGINFTWLIAFFAWRMGQTPLNKVKHKVRGSYYEILGFATVQTADALKDDDRVFVYRDIDSDEMYVRKDTEFSDGRFELIDAK